MSWNQQNGGPWGNPSGGKPNGRPGGSNPWGAGPQPPDLEDIIRRLQAWLNKFLPKNGGGSGYAVPFFVVVGLWLASGFYTVGPNEVGLNMVFGAYKGKTSSGLNYNYPYPIGSVRKLAVTDRNTTSVGFFARVDQRVNGGQFGADVPEESLMLTGDENIADVKFVVIWQIDPAVPENYAFNIRNPRETVKAVAESAMREIVGRTPIQRILTAERKVIEPAVQDYMQRVLNDYGAGVQVIQVQLQSVDPPEQVIASFRDVTAAQQDLDRLRNEAEAYANRVVPEARGAAARIVQEAEAYREQTVAEAMGQAARFNQIYDQYKRAPDVTRQRMYLETMEHVLGANSKVVIDQAQNGIVPYMALPSLDQNKAVQGGGK
jgi:modulator of FtsH protease HflK